MSRDLCDDVRRLQRGRLPGPEVTREIVNDGAGIVPAESVFCPTCSADPGSACVGVQWDYRMGVKGAPNYRKREPHAARIKAYERGAI